MPETVLAAKGRCRLGALLARPPRALKEERRGGWWEERDLEVAVRTHQKGHELRDEEENTAARGVVARGHVPVGAELPHPVPPG